MEEGGRHILAGLVSHGSMEECGQVMDGCRRRSRPYFQEAAYDIYTAVAKYIGWIEKTILSNGGMHSCGYNIAANSSTISLTVSPTTGKHFLDYNMLWNCLTEPGLELLRWGLKKFNFFCG